MSPVPNVSIDPLDAIKCGVQHENKFYIDKRLVFGAVNGTFIFQAISDAVRHMLREEQIYVFTAVESTEGERKSKIVHTLMADLGLPLNPDKLCPPADTMVIMGIQVDIPTLSLSIPAKKMEEILAILSINGKKTVYMQEGLTISTR